MQSVEGRGIQPDVTREFVAIVKSILGQPRRNVKQRGRESTPRPSPARPTARGVHGPVVLANSYNRL